MTPIEQAKALRVDLEQAAADLQEIAEILEKLAKSLPEAVQDFTQPAALKARAAASQAIDALEDLKAAPSK